MKTQFGAHTAVQGKKRKGNYLAWWHHHPMTILSPCGTAATQSHPNIAFIKFTLAKPGRTNRKVCFGIGDFNGGSASFRENRDK
jgi:hypothetical protein